MILLCFPYKPLLTFLLIGASHVHFMVAIFCSFEHILIASIVCEVLKNFLASFFFYCTFIYYVIFKNLNKVFGYRPPLPLTNFVALLPLLLHNCSESAIELRLINSLSNFPNI